MEKITQEFIAGCIERMDENLDKVSQCLEQIEDDKIWWAPNANTNSIGNQILHLCGNITQYAVATLGELPDERDRDREFLTRGGFTKTELREKLVETVSLAKETMLKVDAAELLRIYKVQAYKMSAIRVMIHVVEHFSYHTAQIALLTKLIKDIDLGFYANIDLNKKYNT